MEKRQIDKLIEKYLEGQTSVEEEDLLRATLSELQWKDEYAVEREMLGVEGTPDFSHLTIESQKWMQKWRRPVKERRRSTILKWGMAAASVISIVVFLASERTPSGHSIEITDPELAYQETCKALKLIASKYETGVKDLRRIEVVEPYLIKPEKK